MFCYLDFYTRSYVWKKWDDTLDQALVNYLYYRGKFGDAGIKIKLIHAGEGFLASIYNCHGSVANQKLGSFDPKANKVFPALIHKFSEPPIFRKNIYYQCPRLSWQRNMSEYIRSLSIGDMNKMDQQLK